MKKRSIIILLFLTGTVASIWEAGKKISAMIKKQKEYSDKHLALYLMMNQWVKMKQEKKSVADYLVKNGYQEIAIYGMNYVGETLLRELEDSGVKVRYGIDRRADNIYSQIEVLSPDDKLDEVDAVIVTAVTFFDEIEKLLSEKMTCPVISLEDILYLE